MDFTVAICTYNGQERIPEVLDCLIKQINLESIKWEVIIIDNNSTDRTAQVVSEYAKIWRTDCQIRCILEVKQGLAHARERAVQEAHSDLIGFLDDDNLPKENWVSEAYLFAQKYPQAGAYGGIIQPKLDIVQPSYFPQVKNLLAVNNPGPQPFCYGRNDKPRKVPAGAGLVVRKQVWQECVPKKLLCQGRNENSQTMSRCGDDTEALYNIQNSQWEIWHNPKMEIFHHLENRRLEKEYLLKLARCFGLANHAFRITRLYPWQRPFMPLLTPLYLLSDAYKVAVYYLRYRNQFSTDIGKACEFEGRLGRLLSPLVKL